MIPVSEPKVKLFNEAPFLTEEHRKNLYESGLTDETIRAAGFKTVEVPKWKAASAYEIPYPGVEGFSRLRLFGVPNGKDRYDQPKGTECHLYVPPQVREILSDPSKTLLITEGEKKALKASQEGLPCVAVGGWWAWKIKDTDELIPDFDQIALEGRKVILVPDNDFLNAPYRGINKNILKGLRKLRKALEARGAVVEVRPIPEGPHKGLDDWLCKNSADKFWELPIYELPLASFNLTDLGNAERLIDRHGEDIFWWHERGAWLVWDGERWGEDLTNKDITKKATETVRSIHIEALEAGDRQRAFSVHAFKSEAKGRIDAMLGLAQRLAPVTSDELDSDSWLLNVRNGVINLRTGELLPHRREDLMTKLAPVAYEPKAEYPRWLQFLDEIFLAKKELIEYVQKAVGSSLTGKPDKGLYFLHGENADNGKTTFVNVLMALLGDYAKTVPIDTLMVKRKSDGGSAASPNIAKLKGARFVAASEIEDGAQFAEALVNQLTGKDKVDARFLFKDSFEFYPEFKLWIFGNHRPHIKSTATGLWSRIREIPFEAHFPKGDSRRDEQLEEKLKSELPGILNWTIKGCLKWQADGEKLEPIEEIKKAVEEYKEEMDIVGQFLEGCCRKNPDGKEPISDLYEAYKLWSFENGYKPYNNNNFSRQLTKKDYTLIKSNGAKFRKGLILTEAWKNKLAHKRGYEGSEPEYDEQGKVVF